MEPGVLTVTETATGSAEATSVHLSLTIEGSRLFAGNAAIEKCEEVNTAVFAIRRADPHAAFYVKRVQMKLESGRVTRSSRAVYSLEVTPTNLALLGDVLGALFDVKNVSVDQLDWEYDEDSVKLELASQATAKALAKAKSMASAVGCRLVGIRACSDCIAARQEHRPVERTTSVGPVVPTALARAADFGTELKARKELTATASVEFFIEKAE